MLFVHLFDDLFLLRDSLLEFLGKQCLHCVNTALLLRLGSISLFLLVLLKLSQLFLMARLKILNFFKAILL